MRYLLNEQQLKQIDYFFGEIDKITPLLLEKKAVSSDIVYALTSIKIWGINTLKKYGGLELDDIVCGLIIEKLANVDASIASIITVHTMVCHVLNRWSSEQHKHNYLAALASGEKIGAFALSEPDCGSDIASIMTSVYYEDVNSYLNGQKKWISAGQFADLFLVFARDNDGVNAYLIDKKRNGLTIKEIDNMYVFKKAYLAELYFNQCKVSDDDLIGRKGFGLSHIANACLDWGRYCIAWTGSGISLACIKAMKEYVNTRVQFGLLLKEHQLIKRRISKMLSSFKASRAVCYQAGLLRCHHDPQAIIDTNLAKYISAVSVNEVVSHGLQIFGAMGLCEDNPIGRYFCDAKVLHIIEGSLEVQEILIADYFCTGDLTSEVIGI